MKKTTTFKPGERVSKSGQYERIGPRGGRTGIEVTAVSGKPLPPGRTPGQRYRLTDPTKHK